MLVFLSQHSKTANKVRSRVLLLTVSNTSEILRVSFHGECRTCHREESLKDIQFILFFIGKEFQPVKSIAYITSYNTSLFTNKMNVAQISPYTKWSHLSFHKVINKRLDPFNEILRNACMCRHIQYCTHFIMYYLVNMY